MTEQKSPGPAPRRPHRPTILIIDDEPAIRESLERILEPRFRVLEAGGGKEGLEVLQREPVSIIISDYNMPGMSGVEFLAEAIKCQPNSKRVIFTGSVNIEVAINAINKGQVHYFLCKPCDPGKLDAVLDHLLEVHRLELENLRLVEELNIRNRLLAEREALLEHSLDERGNDLLRANQDLS